MQSLFTIQHIVFPFPLQIRSVTFQNVGITENGRGSGLQTKTTSSAMSILLDFESDGCPIIPPEYHIPCLAGTQLVQNWSVWLDIKYFKPKCFVLVSYLKVTFDFSHSTRPLPLWDQGHDEAIWHLKIYFQFKYII